MPDIVDTTKLNEYRDTLRTLLSQIDAKSKEKLDELAAAQAKKLQDAEKQRQEEAARQAAEKEEAAAKAVEEAKAAKKKADEEAAAAKKKAEEEAAQKKAKEEAEAAAAREKAEAEAKTAREKAEAEAKAEAKAAAEKAEVERLAKVAAETAEAKKKEATQYIIFIIHKLLNTQFTGQNHTNKGIYIKELYKLINSNTPANVEEAKKLDVIQNAQQLLGTKPMTVKDFKDKMLDTDYAKFDEQFKEKYRNILSNILNYVIAYNAKGQEQQQSILQALDTEKINNKNLKTEFETVLKYFDTINSDNLLILIGDETATIDDIAKLTQNINNFNTTFKGFNNPDVKQALYENILGAARVMVRIKPLVTHNTATAGSNMNTYIKPIQSGGYDYQDIITIPNTNKIKIGSYCNNKSQIPDLENAEKQYGPFAAVYPPQYNNFHIYLNMFGKNNLTELLKNPLDENFDIADINTSSFTPKTSLDQEFPSPQKLMNKLSRGGSVVIFGYGFSGSGKTYALIEGSPNDPSILKQFITGNSDKIQSIEFVEIYPYGEQTEDEKTSKSAERSIKIFCSSIYKGENKDKFDEISMKAEDFTENLIKTYKKEASIQDYVEITNDTKLFDVITGNNSKNFGYISNRINLLERHRIHKLRILPTPNNDKSSRSFLQITINLTLGGKLVFFDMPGTENTVRIKTEFLDKIIFKDIKTNTGGNDFKKTTTVHKLDELTPSLEFCNIKYTDKYINSVTLKRKLEIDVFNDKNTKIKTIFKHFIMQMKDFNNIGIYFNNDNDSYISEIGHEIAMFLNGKDNNFYELNPNEPIYFLNDKMYETIVTNFFDNYLNKKDEKGLPMFWSTTENKYCKLEVTLNSALKSLLLQDEHKLFFEIFGIDLDVKNNTSDRSYSFPYIKARRGTNFQSINMLGKSQIVDFSDIKKINNYDDDEFFTKRTSFSKITSVKIYFSNSIIKYIYAILNYLYTIINRREEHEIKHTDQTLITVKQQVFRAATLFIYKYIKLIVNQGKGIVTNLEHLKFFFLSRTFALDRYNINCTGDKKDRAFICESKGDGEDKKICKSLKTDKKEYTLKIKITEGVDINETVNIGEMNKYKLLSILQDLSGAVKSDDLETKGTKIDGNTQSLTLDLFTKAILKPGDAAAPTTKAGAIFVMLTNIKVFRDNTDNDNDTMKDPYNTSTNKVLEKNITQICTAEYDTLEFAQSISSTTIGSESTPIARAAIAEAPANIDIEQKNRTLLGDKYDGIMQLLQQNVSSTTGGNRKFNLKQLLKPSNQKAKTHRNISFKNKKNKGGKSIFARRTKKNI
jgi:hypothetical protein